ncbi:hypothetical protein HD806DRAFT_527399 [Xylariaceae sp. AK1471]|nr:hypothetical protein HD806DRAFT_527399 [Xylariaceae sp. AK1471]
MPGSSSGGLFGYLTRVCLPERHKLRWSARHFPLLRASRRIQPGFEEMGLLLINTSCSLVVVSYMPVRNRRAKCVVLALYVMYLLAIVPVVIPTIFGHWKGGSSSSTTRIVHLFISNPIVVVAFLGAALYEQALGSSAARPSPSSLNTAGLRDSQATRNN